MKKRAEVAEKCKQESEIKLILLYGIFSFKRLIEFQSGTFRMEQDLMPMKVKPECTEMILRVCNGRFIPQVQFISGST